MNSLKIKLIKIPFTIASKNKTLGINLTQEVQDLYTEKLQNIVGRNQFSLK